MRIITTTAVLLTTTAFAAPACGSADAGCAELCAKEVECSQDLGVIPIDQEACVTQCEVLVEDDAEFADLIAERASCYDSSSCEEIYWEGECTPSGE